MRLIDSDNIDYVILEDSLHRIEHKKGDEIDCVIGAETVKAIPLDRIKQAREEIEKKIHEYSGSGNEVTQAYCDGLKDSLTIIDNLIESEG